MMYKKSDFVPYKKRVQLTTGDVISILRELKVWTQKGLAQRCGISPTNLSLLDNNKVEIGRKRAEQIAKVFNVHPGFIMFPQYNGLSFKKAA